jgi:hypothetical protein
VLQPSPQQQFLLPQGEAPPHLTDLDRKLTVALHSHVSLSAARPSQYQSHHRDEYDHNMG